MIEFGWLEWTLLVTLPIAAVWAAMAVFKSWCLSDRKEKAMQEDENRENDYCTWREALRAHGGLQPVYCPVPIGVGEQCYSYDNSVALYMPSEPHEHHGEGVLFDTEPGQPVGGGWSIMDCFHGLQFVGRGRLCVTDKCISFGDFSFRQEIRLEDVHTVAASRSCLLIGYDQMDRPLLFQNVNGQRLRDVIHILLEES